MSFSHSFAVHFCSFAACFRGFAACSLVCALPNKTASYAGYLDSYNHRHKCWEDLFILPFPPLPPLPRLQCWVSSGINCALNIQHWYRGRGWASLLGNVIFDDIFLASIRNIPFLNNGAIFPTTSVRGLV